MNQIDELIADYEAQLSIIKDILWLGGKDRELRKERHTLCGMVLILDESTSLRHLARSAGISVAHVAAIKLATGAYEAKERLATWLRSHEATETFIMEPSQ